MDATPSPTTRQIAAALAIGTVALLILGVQPVVLGEFVDRQRLTLDGVGLVAMGEVAALGLGVLLGNLMPASAVRAVAGVALVLLLVADLASNACTGDLALAVLRSCAGLAAGVVVWVSMSTIVRSAAPARLAAVFLVVQTLAQAAVAAALATIAIPAWGWPAGFATLAGACALSLLLLPALCPRFAPLVEASATAQTGSPLRTARGAASLAVAFFQMAALGAVWAFLEPLGRRIGLEAQAAQLLAALVLVMQVAGGSAAALLVNRWPPVATLGIVQALLLAVTAAMGSAGGARAFASACAVFGFLWLFSMPVHLRLSLRADPPGRLAQLVPGVQLLGIAFGPLLAALFVDGDAVGSVPWVSAALAGTALIAVVLSRGNAPDTGEQGRTTPAEVERG